MDQVAPSPVLASAISSFRRFVLSDDAERSNAIEQGDPETLTALAEAVGPLYDEINSLLDRLTAMPHPVSGEQEQLEEDLNSLAQAGMEARMELENRAG